MNICVMENKPKSAAGRKKLAKSEKKVAVTIWVKQKFRAEAKRLLLEIEDRYLSDKS